MPATPARAVLAVTAIIPAAAPAAGAINMAEFFGLQISHGVLLPKIGLAACLDQKFPHDIQKNRPRYRIGTDMFSFDALKLQAG
jgi:hypothetical protein